jgi:pimeloyl-ACP methyl ester carboxylesterase
MTFSMPTVLVPGLMCSPRLYAAQIPALWQFGPVMVADHKRDDTLDGIARSILAVAPPRFALAGLSMGGYIAFAIMRAAPERVTKLALLDTAARADRPEQAERRREQMEMARAGRMMDVVDQLWPLFVHADRQGDETLRAIVQAMAEETGADVFVRQQQALLTRPDARADLPNIRCPTMVLVGDGDRLTPPKVAQEIVDLIPGSRLVVVPECGHLSTIERPEAVNRALAEWIAS